MVPRVRSGRAPGVSGGAHAAPNERLAWLARARRWSGKHGAASVALCVAAACILVVVALGGRLAARAPGTEGANAPLTGSTAPDFRLDDYTGRAYQLSALRGKRTLLCFFCGCSLCRAMAAEWGRTFGADRGLRLLVVTDLGPVGAADLGQRAHARFTILFDPFGRVARRYQCTACPECWVIDERGRARYHSRGVPGTLAAVEQQIRRALNAPATSNGARALENERRKVAHVDS